MFPTQNEVLVFKLAQLMNEGKITSDEMVAVMFGKASYWDAVRILWMLDPNLAMAAMWQDGKPYLIAAVVLILVGLLIRVGNRMTWSEERKRGHELAKSRKVKRETASLQLWIPVVFVLGGLSFFFIAGGHDTSSGPSDTSSHDTSSRPVHSAEANCSARADQMAWGDDTVERAHKLLPKHQGWDSLDLSEKRNVVAEDAKLVESAKANRQAAYDMRGSGCEVDAHALADFDHGVATLIQTYDFMKQKLAADEAKANQ